MASRPIRVTIVAPGPQSEGGIRSVVERIYPRLAAREDIDVTWLASQRAGSSIAKFLFFLRALTSAFYYLPRSDIVHLHGAVHLSLLRKSAFIWLARLFGCKTIYHFHAPQTVFEDFFATPGIIRNYAMATLRRCTAIAVLSDSWETTVREVFPDANIVVIYNPVMEAQRVSARQQGESRDVLYLAHLIRRKGYDDLLRAFVEVVDNVPDARLVFCGSGETDRAQDLCEELEITNNVVFKGWIAESRIADELASAAVFCLPSYDEGLPMGILEAMSSGVPIVTTPVGGVPDVLTHERNALLFQPGDVAALGKQLSRLLLDSSLRERLAEEALRDSTAFQPQRITEEWMNLYRMAYGGEARVPG